MQRTPAPPSAEPPGLARLVEVHARIGNLTFGGGDPTIAALQRELVERRGWLTRYQYAISYSLARLTPGTNLLAFCAGAGWYLRGWSGAVAAVLAVTIPSAFLVVWLTKAFEASTTYPLASAAIAGTLAAAAGMMAAAAWLLLRPHLQSGERLRTLVLVIGAFVLAFWFGVGPVMVLAIAAVAGIIWR